MEEPVASRVFRVVLLGTTLGLIVAWFVVRLVEVFLVSRLAL